MKLSFTILKYLVGDKETGDASVQTQSFTKGASRKGHGEKQRVQDEMQEMWHETSSRPRWSL